MGVAQQPRLHAVALEAISCSATHRRGKVRSDRIYPVSITRFVVSWTNDVSAALEPHEGGHYEPSIHFAGLTAVAGFTTVAFLM